MSYGLAEADREKMLAVIQSMSKRKLEKAAHINMRSIPETLDEASEMPEKEFRRIFSEASALAEEKRKLAERDELLLRWLVTQVNERGLKSMAELLNHNAANLAKVVAGKRKISKELRRSVLTRNDPDSTKN